jgi:hypothetical protein
METINDNQKIGFISLSKKISTKDISMAKAYKHAVEQLHFGGSIGDFIEVMKSEGLIDAKESVIIKKPLYTNGFFKVGAVGVGIYVLYVLLNKK